MGHYCAHAMQHPAGSGPAPAAHRIPTLRSASIAPTQSASPPNCHRQHRLPHSPLLIPSAPHSCRTLSPVHRAPRACKDPMNLSCGFWLAISRLLVLLESKTQTTTGFLPFSPTFPLRQREVDILRRQLREAGQQLEGYILVSRKRGVGAGGGVAEDGFGDSSREDDLALGADWDT